MSLPKLSSPAGHADDDLTSSSTSSTSSSSDSFLDYLWDTTKIDTSTPQTERDQRQRLQLMQLKIQARQEKLKRRKLALVRKCTEQLRQTNEELAEFEAPRQEGAESNSIEDDDDGADIEGAVEGLVEVDDDGEPLGVVLSRHLKRLRHGFLSWPPPRSKVHRARIVYFRGLHHQG